MKTEALIKRRMIKKTHNALKYMIVKPKEVEKTNENLFTKRVKYIEELLNADNKFNRIKLKMRVIGNKKAIIYRGNYVNGFGFFTNKKVVIYNKELKTALLKNELFNL